MSNAALLAFVVAVAAQSPPPIPHPHPVIMEVLYAVPSGGQVDPNGDGQSDAVFDEFVELVNPHGQSINLKGYAIADAIGLADARDPRGVLYVFPTLTLAPGERVVVFNGRAGADPRYWGGQTAPPGAPNAEFGNAWTFSTGNTKKTVAFANGKDLCALKAPDGTLVDVVVWGKPDEVAALTPQGALRVETTKPSPGCSVQRRDAWSALEEHPAIDGRLYSPGQ